MADVVKVSIAFTTTNPLTASPTWTRIDNLAGLRVRSIVIERGRRDEFGKTQTGTARLQLVDSAGLLDPTNGAGTYFNQILPDKQAKIELYNPVLAEYQTIFRGFVEDFNYTLDLTRTYLTVDLDLVDGFAVFADYELQPGEDGDTPDAGSEGRVVYGATVTGNVGDRIEAVYLDVGWPSGLADIFTGNVRVQEVIYEPGTSALTALMDAADAEFPGVANVYMSREGMLTFHGRQARFRPDVAAYGIRRQEVGDPSVTDADATICPVHELGFNLGKSILFNKVLSLPQGIAEADVAGQLRKDATSITAHGSKSLTFTDLLTLEGLADGFDYLDETALFATYYRDNYKDPLPRVSRMVFKTRMPDHRLADPLWKMLTRVDISDRLTLTTAHPGGGGFSGEDYYVEGVRYDIRPANPQVPNIVLDLDVSPAALFDSNTFDDDTDPP